MTISELAKGFGVRPSTPRFYERIRILLPAGRVSGRREYHTAAEQRPAFILSACESGFTLKEIKGLISMASRGTSPRRLAPNAPKLSCRHGLSRCLSRALAGGR